MRGTENQKIEWKETRGRGIQQVFEVCRTSGAPEPSIRFARNDLWFAFQFSEDYLSLLEEKAPKTSVKILEFLDEHPDMTLAQIAEELGRSVRAVEMAAAKLVKEGHLKYIGHKKGAGAAQPNISREKIIATPIMLPPLAKQKRIVAKIDELMALCDKLESQIDQATQKQTALFNAVLAKVQTKCV